MQTAQHINITTEYSLKKIEYNKIKTLLAADVRRFCKNEKILIALKSYGQSQATAWSDLRKSVSSLKFGEETVYAAIVLALYNDPSGLLVLKNQQRYWTSHSEIEKLHVRAALILLHNASSDKFKAVNRNLSPDLYRELTL